MLKKKGRQSIDKPHGLLKKSKTMATILVFLLVAGLFPMNALASEADNVKLTVVTHPGVSTGEIPDILAPIQGEHITGFTALYDDGGLVFDVEVHGDYTLEEAIAILQGDPRVNFAESQNVAFPYASVPSENGAEDATAPSDSSDTKEKSLNNNPTIGIAPAYRDTQYMSALLPGFNPEAIANGTPIETDEKGGYFQNELVIITHPGVNDNEIKEILEGLDVEPLGVAGNCEDGLYIPIRYPSDVSEEELMQLLLQDDRVKEVEQNDFVKPDAYPYWVADTNLPGAWGAVQADSSVVVAVLDSGIKTTHPSFSGRINTSNARNTVLDNSDVSDTHGHGTMVAGVISSNGTYGAGIQVTGASYGAQILPIKVADSNNDYQWFAILKGLEYIEQCIDNGVKVKVINMSFGGSASAYNTGIQASINRLTEKGVLVVAAAGNDGVSDLHYPAALNNVVCVGATDQNGERAGFSNYGASIDLVAPGATIITTHMNNGYTTTNGTSFSAPIVAGTAALIYKKYGNDITPAMVEAILKATAIAKNSSNVYYDGSGLINAAAAVSQVDYRRFNGADRYDTSVRFANYAFPSASTAILVSGEDGKYPDALVAAGLAGTYNAPILLTPAGSLPILTRNYLINAGVNKVIVVGGTSSVSDSVVAMVQALNKTVVRIAGTDRYETAIAVYNHVNNTNGVSWGNTSGYRRPEYPSTSASWKTPGIKKVAILALGTSFADALSASSLAAYARYPVFLTNGTTLAPSVQSALQYGGFDELLVIGGASAISPAVRQQAMNLVNPVDINGMNWYIPTEGTDRYDTCLLLVKYARLEGLPLSKVILARGMGATPDTGWQDAVTTSTLGGPLLLTTLEGTTGVSNFFYNYSQLISEIKVAGGLAAISDAVPVNALAQWGIKRKSGDYGLPPLSYELLPIAA